MPWRSIPPSSPSPHSPAPDSDPRLAYLGDGLVDLFAAKLEQRLAMPPIDSRTVLDAWRRTGGADSTKASVARALAVARKDGAGRLVEGEVAATGSRVTLSAVLRMAPGGRAVARVAVEEPPGRPHPLVDQFAAGLLARAAGEPEERYGEHVVAIALEPALGNNSTPS